jgi:hypothetical protein
VHAVIFSEDAPALENSLHKTFHRQRINRVNARKEFFHVPIDAIAEAVRGHHADVQITLAAEAADYWKTQALIEEEERTGMQVSALQRFSAPVARRLVAGAGSEESRVAGETLTSFALPEGAQPAAARPVH